MRSLHGQFLVFAVLVIAVIGCGAALNWHFLQLSVDAQNRLSEVANANEGHLSATFYNEEARVLGHSANAATTYTASIRNEASDVLKGIIEAGKTVEGVSIAASDVKDVSRQIDAAIGEFLRKVAA